MGLGPPDPRMHTHTHNAHAHAILGTTNYFVVDSTPRTYCASVAYSVSIGYKIATIHSQQENDMVFATPRSLRRRALELAYEVQNGVWAWEDGTPWDYTNPSNDGMNSPSG